MSPNQALISLHANYIGGHNAKYRKWYFAAQLDLDDAIGQTQNATGLGRLKSTRGKRSPHENLLATALDRWRDAMNSMTQYDRLRQIALYLLCWGEALRAPMSSNAQIITIGRQNVNKGWSLYRGAFT